jgi:hypothetical protein
MSEKLSPAEQPARPTSETAMSALFANMVMQQTNMALMFLGQVPSPESGERIQDLDAARLFIDQLEMLEVKTKGNLETYEDQLLKQSLTNLRMAFVQAVESSPGKEPQATPAAPAQDQPTQTAAEPAAADDEPRKKFTKKY